MSASVETPEGRPMLADLRRQADVLATLLERREAFLERGRALSDGGRRRLFGFGSGDGWFAARAAEGFARQRLNLDFRAASSLEMLSYVAPGLRASEDAAIAISMSGTADRTNEAAEAVVGGGSQVLALTNGGGGALAGIAQAKISLDVTDLAPFLTGTAKYSTTLLGLLMLLEGAGAPARIDWDALLAPLSELLTRTEAGARDVAASLADELPTGVRILSAGPNLATAEYGMAKFVKLIDRPVWSDDVEEFAHRQFWSCPASDLVIYVAANPAVARCATASATALKAMNIRTVAIETPDCPVPSASHRLQIPQGDELLSPLFAAIPLQFLAYFLARAFGGQPDQSQEIADPARFLAAQLLSRRGELIAAS
jgi:glucosamine 6-phosphate synthetase-like amidotransferase/phosphosugar isomerase protein